MLLHRWDIDIHIQTKEITPIPAHQRRLLDYRGDHFTPASKTKEEDLLTLLGLPDRQVLEIGFGLQVTIVVALTKQNLA
jgi:hypothetical protein